MLGRTYLREKTKEKINACSVLQSENCEWPLISQIAIYIINKCFSLHIISINISFGSLDYSETIFQSKHHYFSEFCCQVTMCY